MSLEKKVKLFKIKNMNLFTARPDYYFQKKLKKLFNEKVYEINSERNYVIH